MLKLTKLMLSQLPCLKLNSTMKDNKKGETFELSFPQSRIERDFSKLKNVETFSGSKEKIQEEYNKNPVGQYVGPYDQNKKLKLRTQLPNSELEFDSYTEFRHSENASCAVFSIKKSYEHVDDLNLRKLMLSKYPMKQSSILRVMMTPMSPLRMIVKGFSTLA